MRGRIDNFEYYQNLGKQIHKIRKERKLTKKYVANKMDIAFQQLQKYERGQNRIHIKDLVIFYELTHTDIKELTGCTSSSFDNTTSNSFNSAEKIKKR